MSKSKPRPELAQTELVERLPAACASEAAAVDFLETERWGDTPCCAECGSVNVYKMTDRKTGEYKPVNLCLLTSSASQFSLTSP